MRWYALLAAGLLLFPSFALGGFKASSVKKEYRLGKDHWAPTSALDGKKETCWQVDTESSNKGEWFEIDMPKSTITGLDMMVGWEKSKETFKDYGRIKSVRVEIFNLEDGAEGKRVLEANLDFEDKMGWQKGVLKETEVGSEFFGARLRFTITDIYPGEDYPNIAMSDVMVRLKESDVPQVDLRGQPSSEEEENLGINLNDGSLKTFWASSAAGSGESFRVGATGYGLSSIGLAQGPKSYARPKTVELITTENTVTVTMEDKPGVQWFELTPLTGFSGSSWGSVEVKVVDTYSGGKAGVAMSEVKLRSTNFDGL